MGSGEKRSDTCAVILAGGRSRRMRCNKALLEIGDRPLIETIASLAQPLVDRIFISANDSSPYLFLGLPVVPDIFPGQGPLAGIHAVMAKADYTKYLVLACDMPYLRAGMLRSTIDMCEDCDAVIPQSLDGRIHPLCGSYRRTCLKTIERNLSLGINKVMALLEAPSLRIRWLRASESTFRDSDLKNINEISDLGQSRSQK